MPSISCYSRAYIKKMRPLLYLLAAICCIALESFTGFDQWAQQPFFSETGWLIHKTFHKEYKWLLYTGPKVIIGITGGGFLLFFVFAAFSRKYKERLYAWRKPALLVVCSIIFVPLTVASLKALTGVYSPVDLLPYGGKYSHIGFFEQVWIYGKTMGGRSFPAGHASGGFALMALYYLPLQDVWRKILAFWGFCAGWGMGLYQMARGEHFLSHTLTTMFIALAIITFLACLLHIAKPSSVYL